MKPFVPTHVLVECRILLLVKRKAPQPDQLNALAFEPMTLAHADQLSETRKMSGNPFRILPGINVKEFGRRFCMRGPMVES
jgi:hypothetical protein